MATSYMVQDFVKSDVHVNGVQIRRDLETCANADPSQYSTAHLFVLHLLLLWAKQWLSKACKIESVEDTWNQAMIELLFAINKYKLVMAGESETVRTLF
jgi:hypothetical protein